MCAVFEKAFKKFKCNDHNTNLLYIDATSIYNKKGSELVTINPENKKKKVTKLSLIVTKKGFITSIIPFDINKTLINKSNTSVHDAYPLLRGGS